MAKYLVDYTVLDASYQNGSLQVFHGDPADGDGAINSIGDPVDTGVSLKGMTDPVPFSYVNGNQPRVLLANISSAAGSLPSSCTWTLVAPPAAPSTDPWPQPIASGFTFVFGEDADEVVTNPHGLAQVGNILYFVDYDSQKICWVSVVDLEDQAPTGTVAVQALPLGPGTTANLDADARGQAIIALSQGGNNFLFALYIRNNADGSSYSASVLVRLTATSSGAAYDSKVQLMFTLGPTQVMNAREIIPVADSTSIGGITLLVPAIGGPQQGGATNSKNSMIVKVPAIGSGFSQNNLKIAVTGVTEAAASGYYDIFALAAPRPDNTKANPAVFILTVYYTNTSFSEASWKLYRVPLSDFLLLDTASLESLPDTTEVVDSGTFASSNYASLYFWDLLYENGSGSDVDRIWAWLGSPVRVTLAANYSTAAGGSKFFNYGTGTGTINGLNVNGVDLLAETLSQAAAKVSLKRGLRGLSPISRSAPEEKEEK